MIVEFGYVVMKKMEMEVFLSEKERVLKEVGHYRLGRLLISSVAFYLGNISGFC